MSADFGLINKAFSIAEEQTLEKQRSVTAQECLQLVKDLPNTWQALAKRNHAINSFVMSTINNDETMEMIFNEISLHANKGILTPEQKKTQFVVHATVCLVLSFGEWNALRLLELSPATVLCGLKEAVNYTTTPSKYHKYHNRFQEMVLVDVISKLAMELFPTRYLYGVVSILSDFNLSEDLLEVILLETYNAGKREKVILN